MEKIDEAISATEKDKIERRQEKLAEGREDDGKGSPPHPSQKKFRNV